MQSRHDPSSRRRVRRSGRGTAPAPPRAAKASRYGAKSLKATRGAEEFARLARARSRRVGRLIEGGLAVGRLDRLGEIGRKDRLQAEAHEDRGEQPALDLLVVAADRRLERRDHVADHIFRRVVQQRRQPRRAWRAGRERAKDRLDQQRMLRDGEDLRPRASGRSSARRAPGRARCRRSRRRAARGRSGRAGGPTACAARRAALRFTTAALAEGGAGRVAVAVDEMVVDHADRLHEGVDDRRADEIGAALL